MHHLPGTLSVHFTQIDLRENFTSRAWEEAVRIFLLLRQRQWPCPFRSSWPQSPATATTSGIGFHSNQWQEVLFFTYVWIGSLQKNVLQAFRDAVIIISFFVQYVAHLFAECEWVLIIGQLKGMVKAFYTENEGLEPYRCAMPILELRHRGQTVVESVNV